MAAEMAAQLANSAMSGAASSLGGAIGGMGMNWIDEALFGKKRNALIWADKRFKEAAEEMQEASAKLASGQTAKIGYEIEQIKKSLDRMELDMNGMELDNELKRRVMESKVKKRKCQ